MAIHSLDLATLPANERMRVWRLLEGLTQEEAAEGFGCYGSDVSNFELARKLPRRDTATRIETVTGGLIPCRDWDAVERQPLQKRTA